HRRTRPVCGPRRTSGKSGVIATLRGALAVVAAFSFASAALAQDFPKHHIPMIWPFAAGGTSDVIARAVAEEMGKTLGQPIVIENVAGAGGSTALGPGAPRRPGGHTL